MIDWYESIRQEREHQDSKWGEQNHHPALWMAILGEEYGEVCKEVNDYALDGEYSHIIKMMEETIQVAAVCVWFLDCLERHRLKMKSEIPDPREAVNKGWVQL